MRISDWSSDVCSSDLQRRIRARLGRQALDVLEERAKVLVLEQGLGLREGGVARERRVEGGLVGLVERCEVLEVLRVDLVDEHEAVRGHELGANAGLQTGLARAEVVEDHEAPFLGARDFLEMVSEDRKSVVKEKSV